MPWEQVLGSETLQHFGDVSWHGEGDGLAFAVERDGHAEVLVAQGSDLELVGVGFESLN